jgi:autotransporter-associated beta strand protein
MTTSPSDGLLLESALAYARMGYPVFPCVPGGTFTNVLGTGGGQFVWGNGGFSANTGTFTINVNNDLSTLVWNSTANFLTNNQAMQMGSATADSRVDLQNPVDLNGAVRRVTVTDNPFSTSDVARLSGTISGTGGSGLTKDGTGVLELTGANTYTNTTIVSNGVLRANSGAGLPANSPLRLAGGVLEGIGTVTFNRTVGTGLGQVSWTTNGGFSANGGVMAVNLNNNGAMQTWASTAGFLGAGMILKLGSITADNLTDFLNPINLNGAARTVQVDNNSFSTTDVARLSGVLSGTGSSGLTKTGAGILELAGANTYTGATTISAGTLNLNGTSSNANITIATGARLGGTGTIVFRDGNVIDANGTNDTSQLKFDLTRLTYVGLPITLVDYSGGGTFTGPATLNDCLTPASSATGWSLTDTGTAITGLIYPMRPYVNNANGATNVTQWDAVLNGTVVSTGSAPTTVYVCWGKSDGGTNFGAWEHTDNLGVCTSAPPVSYSSRKSLLHGTYYYRYFGTNAYGGHWANLSASFTTMIRLAYTSRMKIPFSGYNREETLTNFPALVVLNENLPNFRYRTFATTNGTDLRFLAADAVTPLDHEIELWNTSSNSYVWVRIPQLSTNNSYVWACWGDPEVTNQLPCVTNGATWDSPFRGVWHMAQTSAPDATTNRNNGTPYGNTNATGLIAGAQFFRSNYISIAHSPSLAFGNPTSAFSFSAWINSTSGGGDFLAKGRTASVNNIEYDLRCGTTNVNFFRWSDTGTPPGNYVNGYTTGTLTDGQWHHIAFVHEGLSLHRTYADGILLGTDTTTWTNNTSNTQPLQLGRYSNYTWSTNHYNGLLDEVRVEAIGRSSNWVWACYMNQASNVAFNGYETVIARARGTTIVVY